MAAPSRSPATGSTWCIATSVPPLLPRGIHTLEAWTERVCGGAWGRRAARFGERLRQAFDLEHWPAFGESFTRLEQLLAGLATGQLQPGRRARQPR